jgi:hypothetical protein
VPMGGCSSCTGPLAQLLNQAYGHHEIVAAGLEEAIEWLRASDTEEESESEGQQQGVEEAADALNGGAA